MNTQEELQQILDRCVILPNPKSILAVRYSLIIKMLEEFPLLRKRVRQYLITEEERK